MALDFDVLMSRVERVTDRAHAFARRSYVSGEVRDFLRASVDDGEFSSGVALALDALARLVAVSIEPDYERGKSALADFDRARRALLVAVERSE